MRGFSGMRTLLVVTLLFTMLTVVSGFELLNETSDFGFLNLNKIDVQVEQVVPISVEGVVSVYSDNFEQVIFSSIINMNNNDKAFYNSTWAVVRTFNTSNYLLNTPLSGIIRAAYTSFEVDNLILKSYTVTYISGLRGDRLHLRSLYKQVSFV